MGAVCCRTRTHTRTYTNSFFLPFSFFLFQNLFLIFLFSYFFFVVFIVWRLMPGPDPDSLVGRMLWMSIAILFLCCCCYALFHVVTRYFRWHWPRSSVATILSPRSGAHREYRRFWMFLGVCVSWCVLICLTGRSHDKRWGIQSGADD